MDSRARRAAGRTVGHTGAVLLAEVVATSGIVASTSARSSKIAALAELLGRLAPGEIDAAVGFLTGEPVGFTNPIRPVTSTFASAVSRFASSEPASHPRSGVLAGMKLSTLSSDRCGDFDAAAAGAFGAVEL